MASNLLGATTNTIFSFLTKTKYRAGYKLTIQLTSDFGIPSGTVSCQSSLITSPTCSVAGSLITVTGGTGVLAVGSALSVTLNNIRLPRCQKSIGMAITSLSSTFLIENGTVTLNGAELSSSSITVQNLNATSAKSQESNTVIVEFSHSITYSQGSLIVITLPSASVYSGSTSCSIISGLETGATCTHKGSGVIWVEHGMNSADRVPTDGNIKLRVLDLTNPRGLGTYQIKIDVSTNNTSGCVYSSATGNLIINSIPSLVAASFTVSKANRNSLEEYIFTITPKTKTFLTSDSLEVVFPSTMAISDSIQCSVLSSNLASISCSKTSATILTIRPSVTASAYSTNQTLIFSAKYIRNPDTTGLVAGFVVNLKDNSGNPTENFTGMSYTYEGYVTPAAAKIEFKDDKIGNLADVIVTIKVGILIHEKSSILLAFSNKFDLSSNTSLVSASSLPISLTSVNRTSRQVNLSVNAGIPQDTQISLTIKISNPHQRSISEEDVKLSVLTPDSMVLFSVNAVQGSLIFKCADRCSECVGTYNNCTVCEYGYQTTSDGVCQLQVKHQQILPYFLFIGSAALLFLFMVFYGKLFRRVNYWGNRVFALFKVILFFFLAYFGFTWGTNPVGEYLKFFGFGILGMHILLSLVFYYCLRYPTLKPDFSSAHIETNGHMLVVTPDDEAKGDNATLEKQYRIWQELCSIFGVVVSLTLSRWFFSASKGTKGLYWFHRHSDFRRLKITFEVYELMYELLLLLPVVGLCIYTLVHLNPADWHWYMLECIALCLMNCCLHVVACCELIPIRKPREENSHWAENSNDGSLAKVGTTSLKDKSLLMDQSIKENSAVKPTVSGIQGPLQQKSIGRLFIGKKSLSNLQENSEFFREGEENVQSTKRALREEDSRESIRMEAISSLMIMPQIRSNTYRVYTPETFASSSQHVGLRQTDGDQQRRDLDIRLPSGQQTMVESMNESFNLTNTEYKKQDTVSEVEYIPSKVKKLPARPVPHVTMVTSPSGMIQPQLRDKPPALKEVVLDRAEKEKQENQSATAMVHFPDQIDDDQKEPAYKYTSRKTDLNKLERETKVKAPEKSRFLENQLFSKWWFNNEAKKYLEIVYEEEDDVPKIHENSQYEGSPAKDKAPKVNSKAQLSDSRLNFSTSDPSMKSSKWPDRYINGQLESDLNKGILKDRNGASMNLKSHKKNCFSEGIFTISHLNETIYLNAQNPALFIKGLIRDIEGRLYRTIDQDFEMLKDGILLGRDGSIDNINGQKPSEIDLGVFRDFNHRAIDLKEQDPLCFDKNKIYTKDGLLLQFEKIQDPNRFSMGLVLAPNGREYRLKDQDLKELSLHRVYRDRDLNPLQLPKYLSFPHTGIEGEIIDEEDGEESPRTILVHPLKQKFGRSKETIHSGSKQGESRRSWYSGTENQKFDPTKDSMHHYRMTPLADNHGRLNENVKGNWQNTKQSFESFGPIASLNPKHKLILNKDHADVKDSERAQRSESNLIEKPRSKQLSRQQSCDQVPERFPPVHNSGQFSPPNEQGLPARNMNDTRETHQSSNLLYEQHLGDQSADISGKQTSQRISVPVIDPNLSFVPAAVSFQKNEETGSFVNPFKTLDNSRGHGSKERILDDSILKQNKVGIDGTKRDLRENTNEFSDGERCSEEGKQTQKNSSESIKDHSRGKNDNSHGKVFDQEPVVIPKFRDFQRNKNESSSHSKLLASKKSQDQPEKQTGGFKLIDRRPEPKHNSTINMDIPLPAAMSTGSAERFTPTRPDSPQQPPLNADALSQLIDEVSKPKLISRPQSGLSKGQQPSDNFQPRSTGGGQGSLYHRSSLSKRGENSLRPVSGDRRSSVESDGKKKMGRISEVQPTLESSPMNPNFKSSSKNTSGMKPVPIARLEVEIPDMSNENSVIRSQSKVNLDNSFKRSNHGSNKFVSSQTKKKFKKGNSQSDVSRGSVSRSKERSGNNFDMDESKPYQNNSTGKTKPMNAGSRNSQLKHLGSLDDKPVRESPESLYSQTNYKANPFSPHRVDSLNTGNQGTESSSAGLGQESDYNTMLLNLVMDESLDIELDIEAIDDEDASPSRMEPAARFQDASQYTHSREESVKEPEEEGRNL